MVGEYSIISVTFPDKDLAKLVAKQLVENRLAACAQLFPIDSVYLWQGNVCDESEVMMLIKSKTSLFVKVKAAILQSHPYEVPEIVQVPITDGLPDYLNWIGESTQDL